MSPRVPARTRLVAALLLLLAPGWSAVWGQQAPRDEPPGDAELREAALGYFERMLRTELALTDEQAERLGPLIREMQRERMTSRRERARATMELRRAYREGASDEELQTLLERVDDVEQRSRERSRELMGQIDEVLTVRQRVQFRGALQRFQRDVQERVRRLRGGPGRDQQPRRSPPPPPQRQP